MTTRAQRLTSATPAPSTVSRRNHRHTAASINDTPRAPSTISRARQSTAGISTPVSRAGTTITTSSLSSTASAPLPEYELPSNPLNPAALAKLASLLDNSRVTELADLLNNATKEIEEAAANINTRAGEAQTRAGFWQKKRARAPEDDDAAEEAMVEANRKAEELKARVENLTQRMEQSLRKTIDGNASLGSLEAAVQEVQKRAEHAVKDTAARKRREEAAAAEAQATQALSQRVPAGLVDANSDDEGDDEGDGSTLRTPAPTLSTARTQTQTQTQTQDGTQTEAPLPQLPGVFSTHFESLMDGYTSKTLYDRYAGNNEYKHFKRTVHESQQGGCNGREEIPLPHPRTWFASEETPLPGVTAGLGRDSEGDNDDDIAISRQTVSTRCPITLREFEHPVTSKKCPHSFERAAILDMLRQAPQAPVPRNSSARPPKTLRCPVGGCESMLTEDDLEEDKALGLRIKRIQRTKEIANEMGMGDDFADEDLRNGSRRMTMGVEEIESDGEDEDGDDAMDIDELERRERARRTRGKTPAQVKAEEMSQRLERRGGRGTVEDIEDD